MALYKNKYRSESHRLYGWDYSQESIYFITFCSYERECLFGDIKDGKMLLNDFGKIIDFEINKSIEIRKNMQFHACVLMPNHVHFLIEIKHVVDTHGSAYKSQTENNNNKSDTHSSAYKSQTENNNNKSDTHSIAYLRRKPNSISSFVSGFKSITTKQINVKRNTPHQKVWQNNYHDHIVRNEKSFFHIFEYIENNPLHWDEDLLNNNL